jgi:hypothetical protein
VLTSCTSILMAMGKEYGALIIRNCVAAESATSILLGPCPGSRKAMNLPDINDREGQARIVAMFKKALGVSQNISASPSLDAVRETRVSQ